MMLPFHDIPDPDRISSLAVRAARWAVRRVRRGRVDLALSWLVWLLAVFAFALWTHLHYQAPASPPWIGMTVRTAVFAIWTLIMREWIALHLTRRRDRRA